MTKINIKTKIIARLRKIEKDRYIRILYSCESGSRAWGFESKDSDYDIRFIYVNPMEWYHSIAEKPRDTIHSLIQKDKFDIEGWELRKALRLLKKGNPPLLEWINSDTKYIVDDNFYQSLSLAAKECYNPKSLLYHYLHMAKGNIREYLKNDTEVWLKKYLYVIRPLLACKWIEAYNSIPPVNFETLHNEVLNKCSVISVGLMQDIDNLILRKKSGDELSYGPIIPSITDFINTEVEHFSQETNIFKNPSKSVDTIEVLNSLFRNVLEKILKST